MAHRTRKPLLPALLALTSFALTSPAATAAPAAPAAPAVGSICLATAYPSFHAASVKSCNASSSEQRWTRVGELISLTAY